jgi:CopG family nickel-responsive transcriptional regulator
VPSATERVSISLESELLAEFDALLARSGHVNRSEAIRDLIRGRLIEDRWHGEAEEAVATVTVIYDHGKRELSEQMVDAGHSHHKSVLASLHVHLDESNCLEVTALRGRMHDLRHFAEHIVGLKGVKHGKVVYTSVLAKDTQP